MTNKFIACKITTTGQAHRLLGALFRGLKSAQIIVLACAPTATSCRAGSNWGGGAGVTPEWDGRRAQAKPPAHPAGIRHGPPPNLVLGAHTTGAPAYGRTPNPEAGKAASCVLLHKNSSSSRSIHRTPPNQAGAWPTFSRPAHRCRGNPESGVAGVCVNRVHEHTPESTQSATNGSPACHWGPWRGS